MELVPIATATYGKRVLPFLLITTREDTAVATAEFRSVCSLSGLAPEHIRWHRAERAPLGSIDLTRHSGIILGGSPFTVSDPVEQKSPVELRIEAELSHLLDRVVAADFPFLGMCYGIGTIGVHQGAVVDRRFGETAQATTVRLTEAGRVDPLFGAIATSFDALVGHKEAISEVPPHITVLAESAGCPVQAFRVGGRVYATQFHPELDAVAFAGRVRAYAHHGYFDPAQLESIIAGVASADVSDSHRVLSRYVELFGTTTAHSPASGTTPEPE